MRAVPPSLALPTEVMPQLADGPQRVRINAPIDSWFPKVRIKLHAPIGLWSPKGNKQTPQLAKGNNNAPIGSRSPKDNNNNKITLITAPIGLWSPKVKDKVTLISNGSMI